MRIATALLLLLLPISRLTGQATGASVIASAERVVTMPGPGEAVFMVRVAGGLDSSVASVTAALAPARVGPAELASRSIYWDSRDTPRPQEFLFWLVRPGGELFRHAAGDDIHLQWESGSVHYFPWLHASGRGGY